MAETIKEIYNNVTQIFNHIGNSFIYKKIDKNMLNQLKYTINTALYNIYPYYKFNPTVVFNEYTQELKVSINPDFTYFPTISYENYNSHNFIEVKKEDTYYLIPTMKCESCGLCISSDGNLIDGDFSCAEWVIKNILE